MQTKIVNVGVDTLKVNVKFVGDDGKPLVVQELPEPLEEMFRFWQEQARALCKPVPTTATFNDARITMLPNGSPAWKYIIKNNWLNIACGQRMKNSGVAKVTFSSEYLWSTPTPLDGLDEVYGFLMDMFGTNLYLQASQIDLCVDVVGFAIPVAWQEVFITHALGKSRFFASQKDKEHYYGQKLETLNLSGHGNPVSLKIYNKTTEIKRHSRHKRWFHDIWTARGWDGKTDVWRVEFSLERECLRDMQLDDVYEVTQNIKRLWAYCTETWVRMVDPDPSQKRRYWHTSSTWTQLQRAFDDYGCQELDALGPLIRDRKRQANIEQGVAQIAGHVTTLAAWMLNELGEDVHSLDIFNAAYEQVLERWGKRKIDAQALVQEKQKLYHQVP